MASALDLGEQGGRVEHEVVESGALHHLTVDLGALAPRAYGLDVTVLGSGDAGRLRPGSRAIVTHSTTVEILDRLSPGLGDELDAAGYWWPTQRAFYAGAQVYATTYPPPAPGVRPHFTSLPQVQIAAMPRRHATDAGVELAWDQEVSGLSTDPDGVSVEAAARARRSAALFNRDAAGEALAHLRPDAEAAERIRAAAEGAATDPEAGTWLEKAPYGPRGVPTAQTVYRY